ncbi:MAG: ABC transporter substrate-binding protein [Acidobacteriota bacterium]
MVPLFMEALRKDSRVMPRIYQQVDWSNGGDGIVVRDNIKSVADLRGKTIVLAQNSPSHFFALNALISGGVQPGEVNFKFTQDAFQAAAAFNANKSISGAVSWAPDIYNLAKIKGNRMLVNTGTANKLIADVWFARADFAKDNPDIVEGLVRGIFDGMDGLKDQANKATAAKLMAAGYSIPESDALSMQGDAHSTNWAENQEFFLNQNNPTNFERTWNTAYYLYKRIGAVSEKTEFDQVMDFSVLQKLGKEPKYFNSKNEYDVQFAPATASSIQGESDEILTKTVVIHFSSNSWDIGKKTTETINGKEVTNLYDPGAPFVIEEIGKMAGQFGAARIIIEGHTDSSMKGRVPDDAVQELSANRANAVKEAVLKKFPSLQPNQFTSTGLGWDASRGCDRPTESGQESARGSEGLSSGDSEVTLDAHGMNSKQPSLFELRVVPGAFTRRLLGVGAVAVVLGLWFLVTRGSHSGAAHRLTRDSSVASGGRKKLRRVVDRTRSAGKYRRDIAPRSDRIRPRHCCRRADRNHRGRLASIGIRCDAGRLVCAEHPRGGADPADDSVVRN